MAEVYSAVRLRIVGIAKEAGMAKWRLVLLILSAASAWSQTAPFESVELKRLSPTSATDMQIQTLQEHVKEAPGDYAGYDGLGSAFFQKARETGDIAFYDLAEQTLKQALALAPQDFRAADPLVHMALVDNDRCWNTWYLFAFRPEMTQHLAPFPQEAKTASARRFCRRVPHLQV